MQSNINWPELKRLIRISGIKWVEHYRRNITGVRKTQLAYSHAVDIFGDTFFPKIIRLSSYSECREPFSLFYIDGEDEPIPVSRFEDLSARLVVMGCKTKRIDFSGVSNSKIAA